LSAPTFEHTDMLALFQEGEREPGIHCPCMDLIEVSNHVELCGCVHYGIQKFCGCVQWRTRLTAEIWLRWRLVQLVACMPAPMPTKHAASLFSFSAVKKLTSQFTDLLDLTVTENDGLPKHVCTKCV